MNYHKAISIDLKQNLNEMFANETTLHVNVVEFQRKKYFETKLGNLH